ncbi:MAG TPA: GatB/YqeY domain-containing protein, partial [Solirubrobacterales bacterium]|nr:GatB/YqeY domain-containing protein [Solirubrobacterales bacterium]
GGAAASKVTPEALAALIGLVQGNKVSHGSGKMVLGQLVENGGDPVAIVEREGLAQISDSGELEAIVDKAIADNAEAVAKVREGNPKAMGAIVGAIMRETKGRADGGEVQRLLQERLTP